MKIQEQHVLLASALYEIRLLLSNYIGSDSGNDTNVRAAAHLAYALHNEALEVMDGKTFDVNTAVSKISAAETFVGTRYSSTLTQSSN